MSGRAKFQQHCEKLVANLDESSVAQFAILEDDLARIKFLYPLASRAPIELAAWKPKDLQRSESLKISGNKLFQQRSFQQAINAYNDALLRCPQDFLQGQQLYAVLLGNRSAAFFEMKQFASVFRELELMSDRKHHHPTYYKLEQRAGKACEELKHFSKAKELYAKALSALQSLEKSKTNVMMIIDIEERLARLKNRQDATNSPMQTSLQQHRKELPKNLTFPALSGKVAVRSDPERGRFVIAKCEIKPGEIIAIEEPYVHVLIDQTHRTNCAYCAQSINQIIACESCAEACYCSASCKQLAGLSFHRHECRILLTLFDSGVSVNALMALRMITQRSFAQLHEDEMNAKVARDVVIYRTQDYYNISQLVAHKNRRTVDEYLHYTFMATYLLRLLKTTDYFNGNQRDDILEEDEAFIGATMLKYLQILQYNAHEICELQNCEGAEVNYRTGTVGAGLYPTLALFNHSCDPSVIRYNLGNVMVLRAIKLISCGDGVFENYGTVYTSDERSMRISKMQNLYQFACDCQACTENWPLFSQMNATMLRVACDCGRIIPTDKDIDVPFVTCTHCNKDKNLLSTLKGLMPLEAKSGQVEQLFQLGEYERSGKLAAEMLQTYVKYLLPPFADLVLLQERLKSCLTHNGNKKFDYRDLSVANSRWLH